MHESFLLGCLLQSLSARLCQEFNCQLHSTTGIHAIVLHDAALARRQPQHKTVEVSGTSQNSLDFLESTRRFTPCVPRILTVLKAGVTRDFTKQPQLLENVPGRDSNKEHCCSCATPSHCVFNSARHGHSWPSTLVDTTENGYSLLLRAGGEQACSLDAALAARAVRVAVAGLRRLSLRSPFSAPRAPGSRHGDGRSVHARTLPRAPVLRGRSRPTAMSRIRSVRVWRPALAPWPSVHRRRPLHTHPGVFLMRILFLCLPT